MICRASATNPTLKMVSTMVAMRKPAGAPSPLPKPTATGRLPVIAVIGAENATTMNTTPASPMAPRFNVGLPSPAPSPVPVTALVSTAMEIHLSTIVGSVGQLKD